LCDPTIRFVHISLCIIAELSEAPGKVIIGTELQQ
jgi:hypothetical protein